MDPPMRLIAVYNWTGGSGSRKRQSRRKFVPRDLACLVDQKRRAILPSREFEGLGQFRSVYWYTRPYEAVKARRRSTRRRIYGEGKRNRAAIQLSPSLLPSYFRSSSFSSSKWPRKLLDRSDFLFFLSQPSPFFKKKKKFTTINWWNKFVPRNDFLPYQNRRYGLWK